MSDEAWEDLFGYFQSDELQNIIYDKIESDAEYAVLKDKYIKPLAYGNTYIVYLYKTKKSVKLKPRDELGHFTLHREGEHINENESYGPIHIKFGKKSTAATQKLKTRVKNRRLRFTRGIFMNRNKKQITQKNAETKEMRAFTKLVIEILNNFTNEHIEVNEAAGEKIEAGSPA
jgi:hypothetical protein